MSMTARMRDPERWVDVAIDPDEARVALRYAYSDGEWLMGTNGHRIHRIKTKLPSGYYDDDCGMVPCDTPDEGAFPTNISKLFEKARGETTTIELGPVIVSWFVGRMQYTNRVNGILYQDRYLREAASGEVMQVRTNGPNDPLFGFNEHGEYLVMPMKE